ncbi:toprim domain-containing protein [Roseovarius mucosus]|uniref:DUF7146 domain-containing protein n=1 Tax=Roseovarius mucosus TaxID=215743 RepID=UPI001C5E8BE0|nr:toprim domain-containing protein [Roseovarius mucosus]MBW4972098.1 toprim domain-containing protein [Roseovarius mucosus]
MASRQTYSLDEIKAMLLDRLDDVVATYAPPAKGSHTTHGKYFTLNPGRADRSVGSFCVTMSGPDRGRWADFAMSGQGSRGDVLDLIALNLGCDLKSALREARSYLGLQTDAPEDVARRREAVARSKARQAQAQADAQAAIDRRARAAHAIFLSAQAQLRGTPVEYYLRDRRGIELGELGRQPGALRYLAKCKYYHEDQETGEITEGEWPAMVAAICDWQGRHVATHRTWLAIGPDGRWDKAPVPKAKKVLGSYAGAAINMWRGIGPRGGKPESLPKCQPGTRVLIAEGIEDALSTILLLPQARVIAAISLSNLGAVRLPANVSDVTLVADLDDNATAREALRRAIETHQKAGRRVRVFQNRWGGKDLNDALRSARDKDSDGRAQA